MISRVSSSVRDARRLFRWNLASEWVLLLPMLFFAVFSNFSFVDVSANTQAAGAYGSAGQADSGSVLHPLLSALSYCIVVLVMLRSHRVMARVCKSNALAFCLPALAFCSVAWSQFPSRTLLYAGYILLNTLFGLYLAARWRPLQQINLITLTGVVAVVSSFVVALAYPAAGIDNKETIAGGWQGIFPHKNVAGLFLLLLVLPVFCVRPPTQRQRVYRTLYAVLAVIFILLTQSRTAWIVGLLLAATVMLLPSIRRLGARERVLAFVATVFVAILLATLALVFQEDILTALGKDATLTGRTVIWGAVLNAAAKRPFLGFGYFAFWNGLQGEAFNVALSANDLSLGNAENGVLQLGLELGIAGVLLLAACLVRTCRNALVLLRHSAEPHVDAYLMILVFTLLSTVDGMKLFFPHCLPWILYVTADAAIAAEVRGIRQAQRQTSNVALAARPAVQAAAA